MGMPPLREEIALHPGPRAPDGQPTWTLHDPARNLFFRIDWQTFSLLNHWALGDPDAVCAAVADETTLRPDLHDLQAVLDFLVRNELLKPLQADSARTFARRLEAIRGTLWHQLLHHYLFFRIPLVNPDRFLDRWLPRIAWIYTGAFLRVTLGALALGL